MQFNFAAVIAAIGQARVFRIANDTRPSGAYLLNTLLPESLRYGYQVETGTMTIRATMAGLVGMDSPYPPGGIVEASTFLENTAKIANEVGLSEQALRSLQQFMLVRGLSNTPNNETVQREVLNFFDKVILQPQLDVMEWLRGQALCTGGIDWTFNNTKLKVDYGLPAANIFPVRTGNDAYHGSASKLYTDITAGRRILARQGGVRTIIGHPDTIDAFRYNAANTHVVVEGDDNGGPLTFRRVVNNGANFSQDVGDRMTVLPYGAEGEIINPANPKATLIVPFMERGVLVMVGNNGRTGYQVGDGSTEDPNRENSLGYTHIAPTVEGGGVPGRWGQLYTPEQQPWRLHGRSACNGLPVIEAPEKLVILRTEMPA